MNFIDAIRSGRPFRRKLHEFWHEPSGGRICYSLLNTDILADDWEILEAKVEITRAQFWEALHASLAETVTLTGDQRSVQEIGRRMAETLGLGGETP